MSDKSLLNDLNARIEVIIQHVMSNQECQSCQQSSALIADLNSEISKQFKSEEIRFFDSELNQNLDEDNIVSIDKEFNSYYLSEPAHLISLSSAA